MKFRIITALAACMFFGIPLFAEFIFLKDGSIIEGQIVTDAADYITLRDKDQKQQKIKRDSIMRILYTKLKMGKIYIQKRDGEGIVAYMVDEDQESYTFRKDLYKPEEFTLSRADVLFIAEKNPSGLKVDGVVWTDSVSLVWLPPYDEVKKYNVYIKKDKAEKYELAGTTKKKYIKLEDLTPRTTYYIIVTSVDLSDYESPPSNELVIKTGARAEVQLKDGKVFSAYLVGEDKEGYTFREDLEQKEDYVIKRSDVQYITENFPSGLRGRAGTDSIELNWFKPYEPMAEYRIYVRMKGEEYKLVSTSKENSFTLEGLTSNTEYTIKVTGLGKDNVETVASNEFKITTKNILPDEPEIISNIRSKTGERTVTWTASADRDGKVVKYRIYGRKDEKRELIAELESTEYLIKDPEAYDSVELVAVDDRGDESEPADVSNSDGNTVIGFYPGIMMPLGRFGEMAGIGYGGMFDYSRRNLLFEGVEAGLGIGIFYAPGKDLLDDGRSEFHRFLIAPFVLHAGYRFWFGESFSLIPSLSLGGAYFNMTSMHYDSFTLEETEVTENFVDPVALIDIGAEYSITETLSVSLHCGYGMFIEKSGPMQFVSGGLGFEYRF